MNLWLALPLIIPLLAAILCVLARRSVRAQRAIGLTGALALFLAGGRLLLEVWRNGTLAAQMDNWPAPFGVTFVADLFSASMVLLTGTIALAVASPGARPAAPSGAAPRPTASATGPAAI